MREGLGDEAFAVGPAAVDRCFVDPGAQGDALDAQVGVTGRDELGERGCEYRGAHFAAAADGLRARRADLSLYRNFLLR